MDAGAEQCPAAHVGHLGRVLASYLGCGLELVEGTCGDGSSVSQIHTVLQKIHSEVGVVA